MLIVTFTLQFIFFCFMRVLGSECCQNAGDLHLVLFLNASCVGTVLEMKVVEVFVEA